MTPEEYVAAVERDGYAFAGALDGVPLDSPVTSCPGWSVADLLWHMGEVHQFWRLVVELRVDDWREAEERKDARPPDDELRQWYTDGVAAVVDTLRGADPSTPVWTWASRKDVGFVQRRMAQETAVHRWDAEAAAGRTYAIEPALAVDGIDEFLDHFMDPPAEGAGSAGAGSVHLHCTDTEAGEGEWLIAADGSVTSGHQKGDAAARGTASDLLLMLWRRTPIDAVDVVGDRAVLEDFVARTKLD